MTTANLSDRLRKTGLQFSSTAYGSYGTTKRYLKVLPWYPDDLAALKAVVEHACLPVDVQKDGYNRTFLVVSGLE